MSFKIFPATILPDGRKIPLVKDWANVASNDPDQIKMWSELFRGRLSHWAVPTGPVNDILVLDVDVKTGGHETIKAFQIPPTLSQRTVSGGIHYFFKYPKDGRTYGNRVGFEPGLDIRAAGGYVMYYGTDSTPIADAPAWLIERAIKHEPQVQGTPVAVDPNIAQGIIQASLDAIREAPPGESNNVLNIESFKVGQLVASGSVSRAYATEALLKAAIARGKPTYEAMATINSGLDGGAKKPITSPFGDQPPVLTLSMPAPPVLERWTPQLFTRHDLMNTSKLRKPQLFEHWSSEDICITTADGGTGKTTLALFEAICMALGHSFLGFRNMQRGKTLFITGEDTAAKLGAMIGQIIRQMGMLESEMYNADVECILQSIVVKKDSDLCLISKDRQNFIHPNGEAMRKVLEAVQDIKPKKIVFDPISSFWGSESALNDMAKAVTKFMSELSEQSQACVEMINHMGKVSSGAKDMSQFAGRGGTGLPSNSRISRVLRPVFEDEYTDLTGGDSLSEKQTAMMCNVNKFSDGSPLYNKPFLILRDGFLFTRKNLSDKKAREAEQQLTDTERVFAFIKEARAADKYPTEKVTVAAFALGFNGNPIAGERVKRALQMLIFQGHMGEKIKSIENPDLTIKEKAYVITDQDGREV